jgi:pimeloyl-ACP methyl ester carboxylesterase
MTAILEATKTGTSGYAPVNGFDLYYEVHGTGEPLVVVPGGLMTIAMMGEIVPVLAASRQVVAIEPQAHGHTADVDRPLSYEQMADDVAALIAYLGLERADVFGFSVGGGVALQTAIRHPAAVRKLVVVSGTFRGDGEYPEMRALTASFHAEMPILAGIRDGYLRAAPRPEGWPALVEKMRQLLTEEYDWSREVAAIRAPVLIVVGDADTLPPSHAVELFALLGGGTAASAMGRLANAQLALLPAIVAPFLDAPLPDAEFAGVG